MEPSLFVAIPCGSHRAYTEHITSLLALQRDCIRNEVPVSVMFENGNSLLPHARNKLVEAFLASDSTYLLFVDDDVAFDSADVLRMMLANKDVIGGLYPYKNYHWEKLVDNVKRNPLSNDMASIRAAGLNYVFSMESADQTITVRNEPTEVHSIGTGFMLIHRRALLKLVEEGAVSKYRVKSYPEAVVASSDTASDDVVGGTYNFFEIVTKDGLLTSEDYWFCELCRSNGIQLYAATWARCSHSGHHVYGA